MDELEALLRLLEERLVQHDDNRKEVQGQLQRVYSKIVKEADTLEERINGEIHEDFDPKEERVYSIIERLSEREGGGDLGELAKEAQKELSDMQSYLIDYSYSTDSFADAYKLNILSVRVKSERKDNDAAVSAEDVIDQLQEHLDRIHETMAAAQDKITGVCAKRRSEAKEMGSRINGKLEQLFDQEDARVQEAVSRVREAINKGSSDGAKELATEAKATLVKSQVYSLRVPQKGHSIEDYDLSVEEEKSLKYIDFEDRKPTDFAASFNKRGEASITFAFFAEDEIKCLEPLGLPLLVVLSMWEKGKSEESARKYERKYTLGNGDGEPICISDIFSPSTAYCLRMRIEHMSTSTKWSDCAEVGTPEFRTLCAWRECPDYVDRCRNYFVDPDNPRTATKTDSDGCHCIIVGNTTLPPSQATSWSVRVKQSRKGNGEFIWVGVAPSDVNQDEYYDNYRKCGWYFYCRFSTLFSGPPHNLKGKPYGPRKEDGEYVHTGDSVGVVMDTTKGELSFVVNGVNFGVAFDGIPLDKPLVPCALLEIQHDSVELDLSEVKENVDSSIPAPPNITEKSGTCDTITLSWDAVEGATNYQVEVDGSKSWNSSTTNSLPVGGLLPGTEHSFRVRAVMESAVGNWSGTVVGRTLSAPEFSECVWKECPNDGYWSKKYVLNRRNPRVITKNGDGWCTVIGNTFVPAGEVSSWGVKVLASKENNGRGIWIGVAPFDIDQGDVGNFRKCGWYFYCHDSTLHSGPPHNYKFRQPGKEYGPRNAKDGEYVHTGDTVEVVIDASKGELSFAVNGVNFGVAFEGIPLDKPLVPCVALWNDGDSIELEPKSKSSSSSQSSQSSSSSYYCIIS